jgi:acetylornithine deacetylase/succinyl-diaminopimelate desuccinylase-like protein
MKEHADILFLSSNPSNADRLELDREARALQRAIEDVNLVGDPPLRLTTRWAAEPLDLLREIRSVRPTVLHFAGYGARGTEVGIFVRNTNGSHNPAEAMDMEDFLLGCEVLWRTIVGDMA